MKGFSPKIVAVAVAALLCLGVANLIAMSQAPDKKNDGFHRPKPSRPIRPEIPTANRYQNDMIFLEKADSLYTLPSRNDTTEHQIVKGNVVFRQGGMWLYCDSAYYYPDANSMDAFGHVRMEQGDTLFVYSDKIFYDGNVRRATLVKGPSQPIVKLENRDVTLTTDSLDYDMVQEKGWYTTGGTIQDDVNTLTSVYGEYSPDTKMAYFSQNVVLVNRKDDFTMRTEKLDYSTSTHVAEINTFTIIEGKDDVITTSSGWYNTATDQAELTSRSLIEHRDSNDNVVTLEGDSIIYDKISRISRAFMYSNPGKLPRPMVLTDTARKTILIGGYGEFNDSLKDAFATNYPLLLEFSRPDTLYLRADTIRSFIEIHRVFLPLTEEQKAERNTRWLADSLSTRVALVDSLTSDSIAADSLTIATTLASRLRDLRRDILERRDSAEMVDKEFHVAKAYHRGRFFKQDLQGVADSLTFVEYDSLMYLHYKPVLWSEERQISGNEVHVHFNDSTTDWALLPNYGIVAEHADEDFYTQLSAKKMKAYFADNQLTHMDADGNVVTIFLPIENDSTYNKLVNAESSFLSIDMGPDQTLEKMKMWPEVSGTVTPLFMVKQNQKYLPGFRWLESIRPRRSWYGDRMVWDDDLGDVPDALEEYFSDSGSYRGYKAPESIGEEEENASEEPINQDEINEQ